MRDDRFYEQPTLVDLAPPREKIICIPDYVGPYKIESLLSRGGMSILYLGLHPVTREMIAIKVLSPQYVSHPEMAERFLKEAQIIGLANHPGIVKLYGQGQWEGGLYIAMEFIKGISLRQFIIQQSLSLKRSIDIVLQVAYALCHLHSHGVVHGDLKPENILITEEGSLKVIDFGIARISEDLQKSSGTKKIWGTPNYMSPEQKQSPSNMTFSSDVYSLGIIAYELAMGKLSFGIIHLSLLPKELRKIIEKCLAVSIQARYQDTLELIQDLSHYLKSGGLEKDKPGSDQVKEIMETIQQTGQSLSPKTLPQWPQLEMGIAKYKGSQQIGSYFDFFKLPNNSYAIFIGETVENEIANAVHVGVLRGIVRALIQQKQAHIVSSRDLITTLSEVICSDPMGQKFSAMFLILDPSRNTLSFISCGSGGLLQIGSESTRAKKLSNQNVQLGSEKNTEFFETRNNWEVGDTLTLHSLDASFDDILLESSYENHLLSAQSQSEAILKKVASHPNFSTQKNPKVLISIQRIS